MVFALLVVMITRLPIDEKKSLDSAVNAKTEEADLKTDEQFLAPYIPYPYYGYGYGYGYPYYYPVRN